MNKDPITAKIDGYTTGREGRPSNPPNDHGFLHSVIAKTPEEEKADKEYWEGYREGKKDRERNP
jgi:hypothetical protein